MALKEILDKIQKGLHADADSNLRSMIADAIEEASTVIESNGAKNRESERLRKQNEALQEAIEAKENEIKALKSDDKSAEIERLKAIETEFTAHKQELDNKVIADWKAKSEIFNIKETDKRFEKISKIKDRFTLSDEITVDQARKNLDAYNLLSDAGAFDVVTTGTDGKPPITPAGDKPVYKNSAEATLAKLKSQ